MLKDQFTSDLDFFFNSDEHASEHNIDGNIIIVIEDNDQLVKRSKLEYSGVIVGDLLYYAKVSDFLTRPKPDEVQTYDGNPYTVFDCRDDEGVYEIILKGAFS